MQQEIREGVERTKWLLRFERANTVRVVREERVRGRKEGEKKGNRIVIGRHSSTLERIDLCVPPLSHILFPPVTPSFIFSSQLPLKVAVKGPERQSCRLVPRSSPLFHADGYDRKVTSPSVHRPQHHHVRCITLPRIAGCPCVFEALSKSCERTE